MIAVPKGQKSTAEENVKNHEVFAWLLLNEHLNHPDAENELLPEFRMRDNLFTI